MVIGGKCGIYAVYLLILFANLTVTIQEYSCFHAEADSVVCYACSQFLKYNIDAQGSSMIMHCSEGDNGAILLLEHSFSCDLLRNQSVRLVCSIHGKLVDSKTKKPTRKVEEAAYVSDLKSLAQK